VSFGVDVCDPNSWIEIEAFANHLGFLEAHGNSHYTGAVAAII